VNGERTVNAHGREAKINAAFVTMSGALMENYDVVDLLSTLLEDCIEIFDLDAGGILLVDAGGDLELVASTSEEARVVETIIIGAGAGPCIECFTTGRPVSVTDMDAIADKWPKFHKVAVEQGFLSTYAVPMRIQDEVIGIVNFLNHRPGRISDDDAVTAQALANIATLGILHERNFRKPHTIAEQLHLALDTRVLIEQAKGVLAQTEGLGMSEAFGALRRYAQEHATTLRDVAEATARRTLATAEIVGNQSSTGPRT
jgi:transcriptional regulator with GAF, ATPase, and Fis domain